MTSLSLYMCFPFFGQCPFKEHSLSSSAETWRFQNLTNCVPFHLEIVKIDWINHFPRSINHDFLFLQKSCLSSSAEILSFYDSYILCASLHLSTYSMFVLYFYPSIFSLRLHSTKTWTIDGRESWRTLCVPGIKQRSLEKNKIGHFLKESRPFEWRLMGNLHSTNTTNWSKEKKCWTHSSTLTSKIRRYSFM